MSVNNPNFPVGQGDRRVDDTQKQELLTRIPKAHIGSAASAPLALNMSHAVSTYQVTKTLGRQIAPVPVLGSHAKPLAAHQITSINPTSIHKKEIQKAPLSLTSTANITTLAGTGIIPVQISGPSTTTATSSTLQVPNVSSIVRSSVPTIHHQTQFSHLPRGVVASAQVRSGSSVNIQRQTLPTSIQATALNLPGQIRNVIPHMIRPATPPTNRSASPAISIGSAQTSDAHRASISLHNVTTVGSTPSIQITLQASRTQPEIGGKPAGSLQAAKISNQALNMTSQQKVMMTPPLTQVLQHPTLAAKGNRGQPVGTGSVTVALSTTTVTIPIISSGPTSTTIPIAKVPPQRQQHIIQQTPQSHAVPTTITVSSLAEHRTEATSFPQPQPAHSHTVLASQSHTAPVHSTQSQLPAHSQPASNLFMCRNPIVTTSNAPHTEYRESSIPTMPFLPYITSLENPYYQQLMRCQVAAVAQAQARPGMLPNQTTANLAASLQAASQGVSQATSGANVRLNHPLMVMQETLRQSQPHSAAVQATVASQIHSIVTDGAAKVTAALTNSMVTMAADKTVQQAANAVSAVASSLFTATQNLHAPQIGQAAPITASNTPVSNPNASPRPSILRKRTNEGVSAVKKQLAMTSAEVHSPRPEVRPDSTPQSNMSSPKTPASGESQSSTDTALSSEATTPTQPHDKIKQEMHDPHENGYTNNTPEASPRKRRKQLLQATEEIKDTPVSVFDKLVEACVKEDMECNNYTMEDEDDDLFDEDEDDLLSDDNRGEIRDEYVDDEGIRWTLEKCRPGVALLNYYNISWKPRNNHFNRYTDVKPKDERRPTVNELSNQKGVVQKASGWKLYHMAAQIEDLFELEKELNNQLSSLQAAIGPEPPLKTSLLEDESGMIHELTQGNIQRCKLISDQLNDAKAQMLKVLDHKPKISEIITKHMSKRPIKKKERT
ncbi:histone deacetylase complex subunit SAP130-A-like isoform X2 [Ruditapes philippinarum]|uniref:histone deacetylase complex subunit SAP130-A-like isoform X2 n=1 Tax=Ruditapes philippinarum TaxID=129788 RepID=UPI00295A80D6|nr:histone deacetylase complex subunit SAP130-A-like isoform X2 [Ruditapes philippinarum]